jgi:hypothetical protein
MVDILDDGGYMKVVEDVVNREIVVIEVLSSDVIPLSAGQAQYPAASQTTQSATIGARKQVRLW